MPRVKRFKEEEVLGKAMHLFWKQGYAATSVQDLVAHLGINRASLYDTFGDKEQLFKKAFELYRATNRAGTLHFLEQYSEVKEGFRALFIRAVEEAVQDPESKGCFVVNATTELVPNDASMLDILERNKQDVEVLFYEYLRKGKEQGQLTTIQDLRSVATLLFTLYNGIRVVSKVRPQKKQLSEAIEVAMSLLG